MSAMLALALMIAPQAPPSAIDLADAKCVGAMTLLEEQVEAKEKPGIDVAIMFFLGKIAGRSGNMAVGPALKAAAADIATAGTEGATAIAKQCMAELERVTQTM